MKKGKLAALAVLAVAFAVFLVLGIVWRGSAEVIVRFGVDLAHTLGYVFLGVAILALCGFMVVLALALKTQAAIRRANKPIEMQQVSGGTGRARFDPDIVIADLKGFCVSRPRLEQFLLTCVSQLETVEKKRANLRDIEARTGHTAHDVDETLDKVEQDMCKNMAKVINRVILWDPIEAEAESHRDVYNEHKEYFKKFHALNVETLVMVDKLLSETVNYLNEKGGSEFNNGQTHLVVMTEVMQSLNKMQGSYEELLVK